MDTIEVRKLPWVYFSYGQILHTTDCELVEGDDSKEQFGS